MARSGAPQESGGSCGPLFGSPFPKVLKATAKLRTTKSDDGVGAAHGPMHSGTFEACANGDLASGLHHASGSAQTLGVELRVAHAFSIGLEIMEAAAGLPRTRVTARGPRLGKRQTSAIQIFFIAAFLLRTNCV